MTVIRNMNFEIIRIADDSIAIPIGNEATLFHGVVTLSEPAAFLLELLNKPQSFEELIDKIISEYDIDRDTAERDTKEIIDIFKGYGLVFDT